MNSRLISIFCLAAAVSTSALISLSAASKDSHPAAYAVRQVFVDPASGSDQITRGTSRTAVVQLMGSPIRELSSDVWVYRGFHADLDAANDADCSTLVITFVHGEVANLKLVNQSAVSILASNANTKRAERYASTK